MLDGGDSELRELNEEGESGIGIWRKERSDGIVVEVELILETGESGGETGEGDRKRSVESMADKG